MCLESLFTLQCVKIIHHHKRFLFNLSMMRNRENWDYSKPGFSFIPQVVITRTKEKRRLGFFRALWPYGQKHYHSDERGLLPHAILFRTTRSFKKQSLKTLLYTKLVKVVVVITYRSWPNVLCKLCLMNTTVCDERLLCKSCMSSLHIQKEKHSSGHGDCLSSCQDDTNSRL